MSFISFTFMVYFISVIIIKLLLQDRVSNIANSIFLLICNYVFYSYLDCRFSVLLILQTIIVYCCAKHVNNKRLYYIGLLTPLVTLLFFKYYNFFLNTFGYDALNIILPLGISFYTFEAISYIIDVKKGKIEAENNFIIFATYLSFFPNIVSGPIVRAGDLLTQLKENRKITKNSFYIGIQIIAFGVFKKMVIADRLAVFTDDVFFAPKAYCWWTILLAVLSYSIQIYMDFSGYSDIAIGCAKCLGYELKKNFDLPYVSSSITVFWRKWHISLSSWFKDYVYIPLGGNRKGKVRQIINLLIVMTLSGLWHGASWNYIIWGLLNGILLCIEKPFVKQRKNNVLTIFTNFIFISLTWIFFRAETCDKALLIIERMLTLQDGVKHPYIWSFLLFAFVLIVTLIVIKRKNNDDKHGNYIIFNLGTVKGLTLFFIELSLIIIFAYMNTNPFVYFQF